MTRRQIVAVGASAGGVEALRTLAAALPADFSAAILVVLHVPRGSATALPQILSRSGPLPAVLAADGEDVLPGRIYVAPADRHLLLLGDRLRLSRGPSENGHRPAVDPLFRSVARSAGRRAVAVLLSGTRDDGAAGAAAVAANGGVVAVQEPGDAAYPAMPSAALARVPAAHVAPAAGLGALLARLCAEDLPEPAGPAPQAAAEDPGGPEAYGCPDCGGVLLDEQETPSGVPWFRCRVGHAWSPESLLDEQAVATEGALWMALRALEEKAALSRRMLRGSAGRAHEARFAQLAADAEGASALLRELLDRLAASSATQRE